MRAVCSDARGLEAQCYSFSDGPALRMHSWCCVLRTDPAAASLQPAPSPCCQDSGVQSGGHLAAMCLYQGGKIFRVSVKMRDNMGLSFPVWRCSPIFPQLISSCPAPAADRSGLFLLSSCFPAAPAHPFLPGPPRLVPVPWCHHATIRELPREGVTSHRVSLSSAWLCIRPWCCPGCWTPQGHNPPGVSIFSSLRGWCQQALLQRGQLPESSLC